MLQNLNLNSPYDPSDTWGQFIDIENGFSFPEQKITVFNTKPKPKTKQFQPQILKSILKPPSTKPFTIIIEPKNKTEDANAKANAKTKNDDNDNNNESLKKIINRQIYLGCLICILTIGLFILP
jgi:hypothetical protein